MVYWCLWGPTGPPGPRETEMALKLAWKPENLGPKASHVVLEVTSGHHAGTYGVYVVKDHNKGTVRPVGSGRGATLEAAKETAERANRQQASGAAQDCY